MNLLLLATCIQEALLDVRPGTGYRFITEREIRNLADRPLWTDQLGTVGKMLPELLQSEQPAGMPIKEASQKAKSDKFLATHGAGLAVRRSG
jgi:hypothetical protein